MDGESDEEVYKKRAVKGLMKKKRSISRSKSKGFVREEDFTEE